MIRLQLHYPNGLSSDFDVPLDPPHPRRVRVGQHVFELVLIETAPEPPIAHYRFVTSTTSTTNGRGGDGPW